MTSTGIALSVVAVALEIGAMVAIYVIDGRAPAPDELGVLAFFVGFVVAPAVGAVGFGHGLVDVQRSRPVRGPAGPGLVAMGIGASTWILPAFVLVGMWVSRP